MTYDTMSYIIMTICHNILDIYQVFYNKEVINLPTETFLNLSQEKRNRIIKAIRNEFIRVPFDKVSINKIIQEAGISRGSFYMYFSDKEDMLFFILCSYGNEIKTLVRKSSQKSLINIFDIFTDILKYTVEVGTKRKNLRFCKNIFTNEKIMNYIFSKYLILCKEDTYITEFREIIDMRNLNIQEPYDLHHMIDILTSLTQRSLADIFINTEKKDELLEEYNNKLKILKRGMTKEN